jgi:predicted dienelactone hydrolase
MHSVRAVASLSLFVVTLLGACRAEAPGRTKPVTPRLHSQLLFGERETSPVVVLLHGFGADGDDLVPLAECAPLSACHTNWPSLPPKDLSRS